MERYEEELIERYAANYHELRSLYQEHQVLKDKLESFRSKHFLTAEEEVEVKTIQKQKLAQKDKIMAIIERHQHNHAH